jgi:hypothetical protein
MSPPPSQDAWERARMLGRACREFVHKVAIAPSDLTPEPETDAERAFMTALKEYASANDLTVPEAADEVLEDFSA